MTNSSSAVALPLSVDNLVMRVRSIEITLTRGMDAMAESAMAANPNVAARPVVLSPASHFANRDRPQAWNRAVLAFLARCDARAASRRRSV